MTTDSITTKHYRRNYFLGMINGGAFGFVDSVASPYLVLSVFVHTLGAPNLLVGLLPAIANGGWYFPQFLISHRLQELPRKLTVYSTAAIIRVICWILIVVSTFLIGQNNPVLLLTIFFLCYSIYCFAAGFAGTPFMDIVARTIPVKRRGSYFGARDLWGALTSIGAGFIVAQFLAPELASIFPSNFAFLFLISGLAIVTGLGAFAMVVEPIDRSAKRGMSFIDQVRSAQHIIHQNDAYRRFLLTRIMLAISDIATPFYAIYATTVLRIPAEAIGVYIGISTVASLASNPLWSRMSDQRGNRIVLLGAATSLLALPIIALGFGIIPDGASLALPFGILYFISGIARPAANIAYPSYLLEIAPAGERPLYISFTNTILGIATFVPVVGGILLDLFGFRVVFLIALVISLIAWLLARGMTEPRTKK
ncbi:MAG: MFS transporter [Chloroflexi bacterium]|nr:MFS transporter [Chloroflexota bacterium]